MKNKKLKILSAGLFCVSLLGAFSSCGSNTSDSSEKESSSSSSSSSTSNNVNFEVPEGGFDENKQVTIKFYTTMGQTLQNVFNNYLDKFNEIYPNITVESQFIGGYDDVRDQMNTEIASGKSDVNVAYCYPDHVATYNTAKAVISLDNLMEDDEYGFSVEQYDDFETGFLEEGKTFGDGMMYCLPFSKSSEVMYYNKTVFDNLGLSAPTHWYSTGNDDTTSIEYVCEKLKAKYPDSIPLGYDSGSNLFITWCEQLNIPYTQAGSKNNYLFNNSQAKAFMEKIKEWYSKGWITTKDLYGSYTSGLFTSTDTRKCFMCIGSSAGASYQKSDSFTCEIAAIPQHNENNKKVIQQGPDVCIFNNSDPQKVMASWLFVKYFTTNVPFQAEFSIQSGYQPVIKSVYKNATYSEFLNTGSDIQAKAIKVCSENMSAAFTNAAFPGSTNARTQVGNLVTAVLQGTDINTAFDDALSKCESN